MPTSYLHQLTDIVELIVFTNPQSVLDVGVGFGKYGVLCREYLDLRDGREEYYNWRRRVDGIEIFEAYLTPLHAFIYDHIYLGDALKILPGLETTYDLLLLVDVIEHFDYETGLNLLNACQKAARNVLVSTPHQFISQKAAFGNVFETHRSHWRKKHFSRFAPKCFIPNEYSLICYLGEDTPRIKQTMLNFPRRLKNTFPFLRSPYHLAKKWVQGLRRKRHAAPI